MQIDSYTILMSPMWLHLSKEMGKKTRFFSLVSSLGNKHRNRFRLEKTWVRRDNTYSMTWGREIARDRGITAESQSLTTSHTYGGEDKEYNTHGGVDKVMREYVRNTQHTISLQEIYKRKCLMNEDRYIHKWFVNLDKSICHTYTMP